MTSRLFRLAAATLPLAVLAGCGTVQQYRYASTAKLSALLPGTPRVSLRAVPNDWAQVFYPGYPGVQLLYRARVLESLRRTVQEDFGANVFTNSGPDVRVVVEVRKLGLNCLRGSSTSTSDADLTVELKADDRMLGRFPGSASTIGECGEADPNIPGLAAAAFREAIDRAKALIDEQRDKVASRLAGAPTFAQAGGGPIMARPGAAGLINVAVAELDAQEVPASTAAVIADWLRGALVAAGSFSVVERGAMNKVLAEQAFQQTGCTNQECAVKLGRVLNVQRMVVGSVAKFLNAYVVNVRVVDVETGRAITSDSAKGVTVDEVERAVKEMAQRLAR